MEVKIKFESILKNGDFYSNVSDVVVAVLQDSINLKKQLDVRQKKKKEIDLDFTIVNKLAIKKRGNLKVYQNLPKGIRVVAN